MKTCQKTLLLPILLFLSVAAFAQNNDDAKALVKQGVALNDSGKYDRAIEKYNQAIKADPQYANAYYEMGYTLFTTGKEKEAIPYLEKVLALEPKAAGGYDMLGSIYDDLNQSDKAIDLFKKGIGADSTYQRLHYNIAITYYRLGKFPESEQAAIKAIKLDATHASSQRILAMATYKQKKRGISLLAWCDFLLLEPQSKRSPEALNFVKTILNYGVKRAGDSSITISVNPDEGAGNLLMPIAISTALDKKTNLSAVDSVQFELTSLLQISASIIGDDAPPLVKNYYAGYFEQLAKSGNMPAFARYITLSAYRDENLAWFKEHDKELKDLQQWVAATKREF
ncbi:tetratricopeptide repeat protein [Mucilaginibacter ginsenosidivorans]|uniref:Tetratricopeptide repeat protein n=1 Tax=Mucilaginibacter ginsenosidivorans TaxID=398053 RepID=A0A5B8USS9_9SPHI|nr:tetratricopeptide repeat protein [Mucilaginibacter ginsenosidivorans]QEC61441.1 tetratricopeptide repeat protein [Mucilaginibacter ginsenosidivorans]